MITTANKYLGELQETISGLPLKTLEKIKDILLEAHQKNRQIFMIGNGGSASTSSHITCDIAKGILGHTGEKKSKRFKIISLNDNVALMSAWANDTIYDNIFSEQIKNLAKKDDIVIALSASGNSPNIIKAVETANEISCITIGLAGFNGGKLAKLTDICLTAKIDKYDIAEDTHLILGHILTRWFFENV
ncbi:MAG: SIS domain-containing protein [bacterium]|nr:SIS domain-containing protein [bacterium]